MRKPAFCLCENKDADQLCSNRTADQQLCFCSIVRSLYYLNPKFQASSHLWLYSPDCVGPGPVAAWISLCLLLSNTVHENLDVLYPYLIIDH